MIVLSAGLPKSGTGWYYNLTNDLLIAAGRDDARAVRERYHLHNILDGGNCRLVRTDLIALVRLFTPHFTGHSFAVKTHAKPRTWLKISRWIVKPTYIYRDPRDVALSAFDNGQRLRQQGIRHRFAEIESVEDAIRLTSNWLKIWRVWSKHKGTLFVRYEELLANPLNEMQRLATYLGLQIPDDQIAHIIAKYQDAKTSKTKAVEFDGLHFNKGISGRYQHEMTPEQLAYAAHLFGTSLHQMGYE